jgi:hypothetical protein
LCKYKQPNPRPTRSSIVTCVSWHLGVGIIKSGSLTYDRSRYYQIHWPLRYLLRPAIPFPLRFYCPYFPRSSIHRHRGFFPSRGEIQQRRRIGRELRIHPIFGLKKDANQLLLFPVVSLLGVVLIAQPPFIFDSSEKDLRTVIPNGVTAEQRMAAVWCVIKSSFLYFWLNSADTCSVSLISALGFAGACNSELLSTKWPYKLILLLSPFNPSHRQARSSPS